MNKIRATILLWLGLSLLAAPAMAWQGVLALTADGDTFTLQNLDDGNTYRIRAFGLDCPELNQPWGREAREAARELLEGANIGVATLYLDNYDRSVAIVINQTTGQVLQEELIYGGMCWVYDYFCRDCEHWQELQNDARRNQRGLWSDPDPVPPWTWRRNHPSR